MARRDKLGYVVIAEPYSRWVPMVITLGAFVPGFLLTGVLADAAFVAGAAVLIWGWSRAWRMGLRLDDHGVTVRNFFRTYRISWAELRCFADGWVSLGESGRLWALQAVRRDGRVITAKGTSRGKGTARPETLAAIQQAAERYAVPAVLTGTTSG